MSPPPTLCASKVSYITWVIDVILHAYLIDTCASHQISSHAPKLLHNTYYRAASPLPLSTCAQAGVVTGLHKGSGAFAQPLPIPTCSLNLRPTSNGCAISLDSKPLAWHWWPHHDIPEGPVRNGLQPLTDIPVMSASWLMWQCTSSVRTGYQAPNLISNQKACEICNI